jgi:hypothetical protein
LRQNAKGVGSGSMEVCIPEVRTSGCEHEAEQRWVGAREVEVAQPGSVDRP